MNRVRLRTLLTAPLWLAQGLHLALTAQRLPEAAGPRQGRIGAGRLRLVILGDSSAAGVGVDTQDQALAGRLAAALADLEPAWTVHARSGATTATTLASLVDLPAAPADAAILALGVNDVTRPIPLARWLDRQRILLDRLRTDFGLRHLYLSGVPPMGAFPALPSPLRDVLGARARRFDVALMVLAAETPGARHVPFDGARLDASLMARDGYHPGPEIYAWWADRLAAHIRADFAPPTRGPA